MSKPIGPGTYIKSVVETSDHFLPHDVTFWGLYATED